MSSKIKLPFTTTQGYEGDNEPAKPLISSVPPALLSLYGVDLQKEYEKQDQRIEESKNIEQNQLLMMTASQNNLIVVAEHQYNNSSNNTPPKIGGVLS